MHWDLKKIMVTAALGIAVFSTAGCSFSVEKEQNKVAPIAKTIEDDSFSFVEAEIGNVYKTEEVSVSVKKAFSVSLYSSASSYTISDIKVEIGEEVKTGQTLMVCKPTDADAVNREYEEALSALELCNVLLDYYNSLLSVETQRKEVCETYNQGYDTSVMDDITDKLSDLYDEQIILQMQFNEISDEISGWNVVATMDGTVSYIADNEEGWIHTSDEVLISIDDDVPDISSITKNPEYFTEGETYTAELEYKVYDNNFRDNKKEYTVEKISMDFVCMSKERTSEESSTYKITFLPAGDLTELPADRDTSVKGNFIFIIESAENVVCIPKDVLISAGMDEYAVYMENEDGSRRIQKVEIGVMSDQTVEVKNGLEEGDIIITNKVVKGSSDTNKE